MDGVFAYSPFSFCINARILGRRRDINAKVKLYKNEY